MGDFKFGTWPTEYQVIKQHFGVNRHYYAQFGLPGHDGIDIRAPMGSKIFCVAPGEVYRVHKDARTHNYGVHVRVVHQDGYRTIYGHLQRTLVHKGQIVEGGTVLGTADSTGNSFGTQLHLTLKKGSEGDDQLSSDWPSEIVDPTPYLLPFLGWLEPTGPYLEGWVLNDAIVEFGNLGQVCVGGATLYIEAKENHRIPTGTIIILVSKRPPYARIRVSKAAIGLLKSSFTKPSPEPPPIIATVDGWAWKRFLTRYGQQAVVGSHGVNVREGPERSAPNVGMVKAGSTVSLRGEASGQFLPVRVRRLDFIEPVGVPDPPPQLGKLPPEAGFLGWVLTQYLSPLEGNLSLTSRFGVNLRNQPDETGQNMGLVKAFATVRIAGLSKKEYTPVLVRKVDVINVVTPLPKVTLPKPIAQVNPDPSKPVPDDVTIPGWSFTAGLVIVGNTARVSSRGSGLRAEPRRDAKTTGYIPPDSVVVVTGPSLGEYTPVRVWEKLLKPPDSIKDQADPDAMVLGQVPLGLHATMDSVISEEEHRLFAELRPGLIKVFSTHGANDIARLAAAHPGAKWIVRTHKGIEGQRVTPGQYVNDTIKGVRRVLEQVSDRDVVVELHNEPNTTREGLGSSWSQGDAFAKWWLDLVEKYRRALPGIRFIYPGLSIGNSVAGVKRDHIQFLEASRLAVEAADGIGLHLYWSNVYGMDQALQLVDDTISRFRDQPIWITEAGRRGPQIASEKTAEEYLRFWSSLQKRTVVRGLAFFIASSRDPEHASQTWLGRRIAKIMGGR